MPVGLRQTDHFTQMTTVLLEPSQLPPLFQTMLRYPEARAHMLFLGPPGSSKTTTATSFATALHGKVTNRFSSLLFLNSSDERSLDTMRQKVYPFVESRMQSFFFGNDETPPKVIIFDEAETLTDQAQCSLRPLLQRSTKDVILIFICNSLSHIHPQILNKFLIVPFTPTNSINLQTILGIDVPRFDSLYRRGDIRFFKHCPTDRSAITSFLYSVMHVTNKEELYTLTTAPGSPFRERITWFLLFQQSLVDINSHEVALWSALTASETQVYLEDDAVKDILWKLWTQRMLSFASFP